MANNPSVPDGLYSAIAAIIEQARDQVKQVVNQQMVQAYWHIGRLIVEQEQQGRSVLNMGNNSSTSYPVVCRLSSVKGLM